MKIELCKNIGQFQLFPLIIMQACPQMRGILHRIFRNPVQHAIKKWTQLDLRFC